MSSGRDRPYYWGKHQRHGVNVLVLADPAGRLIWASPALPGARHDRGAAREHGVVEALTTAGIRVVADSASRSAGANVDVPQRRRVRQDEADDRSRPSRTRRPGDVALEKPTNFSVAVALRRRFAM